MQSILFVCLGNICRSPAAEGIFQTLLTKHNLTHKVEIDSAGTSAYHQEHSADARMIYHASQRGYELKSVSRQFITEDFENFDLILVMDHHNYQDVLNLDHHNLYKNKVKKMTEYCKIHNIDHVPDPYIGGSEGFEWVLDILEDACNELLTEVK